MPIFNYNFQLIDFFSFTAGNSDGEESSQSDGEKTAKGFDDEDDEQLYTRGKGQGTSKKEQYVTVSFNFFSYKYNSGTHAYFQIYPGKFLLNSTYSRRTLILTTSVI